MMNPELLAMSAERMRRWHGDRPWTPAEALVAALGELGELAAELSAGWDRGGEHGDAEHLVLALAHLGSAANATKKLWRIRDEIAGAEPERALEFRRALREGLHRTHQLTAAFEAQVIAPMAQPEPVPTDWWPAHDGGHVGEEWADVVLYLVVLATLLDVDVDDELASKFNAVSDKMGWPDLSVGGQRTPPSTPLLDALFGAIEAARTERKATAPHLDA